MENESNEKSQFDSGIKGHAEKGAPESLYFVADTAGIRQPALREVGSRDESGNGGSGDTRTQRRTAREPSGEGKAGRLADIADARRTGAGQHSSGPSPRPVRPEQPGDLGHADRIRCGLRNRERAERTEERPDSDRQPCAPGILNGFWADAEWLWCRDGKYRPIPRATKSDIEQVADVTAADLGLVRLESRKEVFFPLIQKAKNRIGRLRGYGNALVAVQAQAFIEAYMETRC